MSEVAVLKQETMRPLVVSRFEEGEDWDAFLSRDPASTFCHRLGWSRIMADVLGHEPFFLYATSQGGVLPGESWEAVLPMVRVRSRLFGDYLVSMPFLNAGGAVGSDRGRRELAAHAIAAAARLRVDLLEIRSRAPTLGLRSSPRKIAVTLDLPTDVDALWASFPSKLRSQVRRSMREGFRVAFGAEEHEAFYEVFARNMRDLGTPVLPLRFFRAMVGHFPEEAEFGVVYDGERPIAAGCGFHHRGEFEITWASSLREYSRSAPNMLLYWSFMERVIARGARRFDFGRCTPNSGSHRFKRQWGGVDVPLPWGQWSPRGMTSTPTPDKGFALAAKVWSRLPVPFTSTVGPVIARSIP